MAETTLIGWARSTRNFWTGCTKIGPGCDGCFAAARNVRYRKGENWGPGAPRWEHLQNAAKDLRAWNKKAAAGDKPWRVFIDSDSDFFDNEVPEEWRRFAWNVIADCRSLIIMIVTKRVGNVLAMLPEDWGPNGYHNVWIIATIVNQEEVDRDIRKLRAIPAAVLGISYEPALGPIDWETVFEGEGYPVTWVIAGGESDQHPHKARPFDIGWVRDLIAAKARYNFALFVKQLGSLLHSTRDGTLRIKYTARDAKDDPESWPEDVRVQEFPV